MLLLLLRGGVTQWKADASSITADSLSTADGTIVVGGGALSLSDTVTVSDAATRDIAKILADTSTVSDFFSSSGIGATLDLADTTTITDAAVATFMATYADTTTVTDAAAASVGLGRSDTTTVTDAATASVGLGLTDTSTITDFFSSSSGLSLAQSLADTATLTDAATAAFMAAYVDTITVTDAVAKTIAAALADTASPADTPTNAPNKLITDTASLTDVFGVLRAQVVADTITIIDVATTSFVSVTAFVLFPTDAVTVTDVSITNWLNAGARPRVIERNLKARVRPPEGKFYAVLDTNAPFTLVDTLTITDTLSAQITFLRTFTDGLTATDTLSVLLGRSVADTITMVDNASMTYVVNRALADTATVSDGAPSTLLVSGLQPTDAATVTDIFTYTASYARTLSDSLTMTDASTTLAATALSDTATVTDAAPAKTVSIVRADTATVTDNVVVPDALTWATLHDANMTSVNSTQFTSSGTSVSGYGAVSTVLPSSSCYFDVTLDFAQNSTPTRVGFLGVCNRPSAFAYNTASPDHKTWYWSGSWQGDATNHVNPPTALVVDTYRIAINRSNGRIYMKRNGNATVAVADLPAGSNLYLTLLGQGGYDTPGATIVGGISSPGSGGLY